MVSVSNRRFDAFSSKKVSQNSLAFEKAAVVFNLGAVCSAIAATQDRSQAMGIKTAFNYLQVAAGQFQFINDHFMHPPSVDMSRDSVRFLTDLMLAQAQECFIENGLIDGKKGKLIARLSFQLSQAYSGIIDLLADPILAAQMDPIWLQVLKTKYKYFKALGYYHLSLQYEADGMYGIIVTLMDAAEGPIRESTAFANLIGTNSGTPILSSFANAMLGGGLGDGDVALQSAAKALLEMVKTLYQLIMMRKTSSTKDNDLIYHEPVPSVATLGTPDMLCAVKPVPIAQIFPNGQVDLQQIAGHDIFRKLIPIQAHESASLYSQAKDALYRDISSRVREIDESVEATLLSLDFHKVIIQLKQSLKNAEPEFSLPQDLSDSIQTFKRDSNNDIEHIRLAIINLKQSFKEEIDKLFLSLNEEQQSCERKRVMRSNVDAVSSAVDTRAFVCAQP